MVVPEHLDWHKDINEYFNKYNVNNESNKFKRLYKESAEENLEKT